MVIVLCTENILNNDPRAGAKKINKNKNKNKKMKIKRSSWSDLLWKNDVIE